MASEARPPTVRQRRPTGTLPTAITSFVGRRREIAEVRRRLSESRLVTLTGVGGVGKTRLAVEAANQSRKAFGGRVWMVDLSPVADGAQVPQTVLTSLALTGHTTRSALDRLVDHLADGVGLIVLDNCEHLLGGCAAFVAELLGRTDDVRVLATSRQILGVTGEHLFSVPPLSVPDVARVPPAEALGQYESIRLLLDRATALQPGFAITEHNRVAAARLCVQLDGIPLAIELAATRLRTLSLPQLVQRLGSRFQLLTGGSPAAQPRQQTLRSLIDWSHSLCSPDERLLWARLSVFAGTFDLAACEGICAGGPIAAESVLDLLDRLVAQSIVVSEARDDAIRFRLLETIREYGWERLAEAGEAEALRLRHRDFYLDLAERVAAHWCGPTQQADLEHLRADHGNLRTALETSVQDPAGPGAALRLAVALRNHWYVDGFLSEGRYWLDRALALPGDAPPHRPNALWVAAWVALLQGDSAAAQQRLAECDTMAAGSGDDTAAAFGTSLRGKAELFRGNLPAAIEHFDRALSVFRAAGRTEGILWAMFQFAISLSHAGQSARAAEICREALAISEAHGERVCRSYTLWVQGFNTWRHAEPADAAERTREGLAIQQDFRDPVGVGLMIDTLAWIAASRGDLGHAGRLLGTAASVWQEIGTTILAFGPALASHRAECERLVRSHLGERGYRAAVEAGRRPSVAHAIAAALDERPTGAQTAAADPLSRREREVAGLVAEGSTNREIAAKLVIATRTVDGHVERILTKLGFTSRAQVAAWVAGRSPDRLVPETNRYPYG